MYNFKFPIYEDKLDLKTFPKEQLPLYIGIQKIQRYYPMHHHDFVELALILEGQGTAIVNGQTYHLQTGTLLLLLPHQIHDLYNQPEHELSIYCCMFDMTLLFNMLQDADLGPLLLRIGDDLQPLIQITGEPFATLKAILDRIQDEYANQRIGRQICMVSKLLEALLLFVREHPELEGPTDSARTRMRKGAWEFIRYVHTHYLSNSLSLEEVADRFGVSVSYVSKSFKEALGHNFHTYLQLLRIRRASNLLAGTPMTVAEVCAEVGFESYRTFSRVFKQLTGLTPTEYRSTL